MYGKKAEKLEAKKNIKFNEFLQKDHQFIPAKI